MQFTKGKTYSRREISDVLGGSIRLYLPTKAGRVVCGCFMCDPKRNPGAPTEVTLGKAPIVQKNAELVSTQAEPIPVFIFQGYGAWEYVGLYRCRRYSTDSGLLRQKMRDNPKRGVIGGVLYFDLVS